MQSNSQSTHVALIQHATSENPNENLQNACKLIVKAAEEGANVVCLQELFLGKYFCQEVSHENFKLAETIPGASTNKLAELAKKMEIVIVASIFERRAAGVYHNSCAVLDVDGSLAGIYRKSHIPDDPCFHEKFYFTPGDTGVRVFDTKWGKIGVAICWDQWFPEIARMMALSGAEIVFYPTAIGWISEDKQDFGPSQQNAWLTVLRSHAITNGMYVAAPNRVGIEGNIEFWGNSVIYDPYGNELACGDQTSDQVVSAVCDLATIDVARTHWPFMRDRRVDMFDDLLKKWNG